MYMKDSAKKQKINPRNIDELSWEYDRPQKEKIRRRRRRHDDDAMERTDGKKSSKRQRNKNISHS